MTKGRDTNFDFKGFEQTNSTEVTLKDGFYVPIVLRGQSAAVGGNYGIEIIARNAFEVSQIAVRFRVASTSGTLNIEKIRGNGAEGTGVDLCKTDFSLSGAINTVVTKSGVDLVRDRVVAQGDSLALVYGGTLTNLEQLVVTIYCKPFGRGNYR